MYRRGFVASAALLCFGLASVADAASVTFTGSVTNTCVINLTLPGTLGLASSGTTLSSEEAGGSNAIMAVIATGSAPVLQFSAPALAGPTTSGTTKMISYTSLSGTTQAYTADASSITLSRLLDTVTVKARATNADGFASGTYTISSTVTCQQ